MDKNVAMAVAVRAAEGTICRRQRSLVLCHIDTAQRFTVYNATP